MTVLTRNFVFWVAAAVLIRVRSQAADNPVCQEISVETVSGFLVPVSAKIAFVGSAQSVEARSNRDGHACAIFRANGQYTLTVRAEGFEEYTKTVFIDGSQRTLVAVLRVAAINDVSNVALNGSVKGDRSGEPIWIHLVQALGDSDAATRLRSDGTFRLSGRFEGRYVVLVVSAKGLLASKEIRLGGGDQFIELEIGRKTLPSPRQH